MEFICQKSDRVTGLNLVKKGFTLIELLVVIAIIGILAAIILPVYSQAKKSAYRSADMSNMNQLRTALGLYKVDQGAYPPALLGYVTQYAGGPNPTAADVLPANQVQGALFPKRVNSLTTFNPALNRPSGTPVNNLFSTAVWPQGILGTMTGFQKYGPTTTVERCDYNDFPAGSPQVVNNSYYLISGYDAATVNSPTGKRVEIHYAPFWSYDAVPTAQGAGNACASDGSGAGSSSDLPNQLGYSDPPETTVVTWDSFFRDYNSSGLPSHIKQDLVLFLGGDTRPYDSANVASTAWQIKP